MPLAANWRAILRHAWSVRLMGFAGLFSAIEVALPYLKDMLVIPAGTFAIASALSTGLAAFLRLLAQKSVTGETK